MDNTSDTNGTLMQWKQMVGGSSHYSEDGRAMVVKDVDIPGRGHVGDGRWFLVVDKKECGKFDSPQEAMVAYDPAGMPAAQ